MTTSAGTSPSGVLPSLVVETGAEAKSWLVSSSAPWGATADDFGLLQPNTELSMPPVLLRSGSILFLLELSVTAVAGRGDAPVPPTMDR